MYRRILALVLSKRENYSEIDNLRLREIVADNVRYITIGVTQKNVPISVHVSTTNPVFMLLVCESLYFKVCSGYWQYMIKF